MYAHLGPCGPTCRDSDGQEEYAWHECLANRAQLPGCRKELQPKDAHIHVSPSLGEWHRPVGEGVQWEHQHQFEWGKRKMTNRPFGESAKGGLGLWCGVQKKSHALGERGRCEQGLHQLD